MANSKITQARELISDILNDGNALPIETIYAKCAFDYDVFAGVLNSLIEKGVVRTGRTKTAPSWFVGRYQDHRETEEEIIWYQERNQMRRSLSKILKEIRKIHTSRAPVVEMVEHQQLIDQIKATLADGMPRTAAQLAAEIGLSTLSAPVTRHLTRLPDGSYTLPDSEGARTYFWSSLREKPRRLSGFMRLLQRHQVIKKEIMDALVQGERLLRLPGGFIATPDSAEAQAAISRKHNLDHCQRALQNLAVPFFTLEEAGVDPKTAKNLIDKLAVAVTLKDRQMLCLRRDFPGQTVKEQLFRLTGRELDPPQRISAPGFLKTVSVGEKEILNYLNIDNYVLEQIVRNKALDTITLDGRLRFWRGDMERLKTDHKLLRQITKDFVRYNVSQAAVLLNTTTGQVKNLINEGRLKPSVTGLGAQTTDQVFSRKDIVALQTAVSATTSRRRPGNLKEKSFPGQAGKNNLPLRKRVVKQLQPTEQPGQFQLDAFQTQAVAAVRANRSVLLAAPTGNGKTLVAEILAKDLIFNGKRMVYTSPLKALSNQKFRDFKKIFGEDQVGLVTGDVSVNSGAPLLIMTTEIFRNWCLSEQDQLTDTVYVVFDEFHYLDDQDRGTTWEESILFAPPHVRFLGLSATVPNIKEIAAWVSAVRGDEVIIIEEHKRRVPLEICWLSPTGQIVTENEARQEVQDMVEYQKAFRNRKLWAEE